MLFDFNENSLILDETLLSVFLSALGSLSEEIFKTRSNRFVLDYGKNKITEFKGEHYILTIISNIPVLHLQNRVRTLFHELESLELNEGEIPNILLFKNFRRKLIRLLFRVPISEDWLVIPNENSEKVEITDEKCPMTCCCVKTKIKDCDYFSPEFRNECYEKLNFAYYMKAINFENVIEEKDYILATDKIQQFYISNDDECLSIIKNFPNLNFVKILKDLEKIVRIKSLLDSHGDRIVPLLEKLHDKEYIKIVDEEKRQIYIMIDILSDLVGILSDLIDRSMIQKELQTHLEKLSNMSIASQFDFEGDRIEIQKSKIFLNIYSNEEIKNLNEEWQFIAVKLIEDFYQKLKKRFISHFQTLLMEKYLPFTHAKDLDIIDPLLMKLEQMQIK